MLRGTVLLAALLALVVAPAAVAAPGSPGALDPTFGGGGVMLGAKGLLNAGTFDAQGRIVTAGIQTQYSSGPILVSRWTADGAPDESFGIKGTVTLGRPGALVATTAVATAADGSVYVAGGGNGGAYVTRLDAAGATDGTWGSAGTVDLEAAAGGYVWGMVDTPSGLVVAYAPFGMTSARLVRLTASGALDPAFSGDGIAGTTFDPATLPPTGASGQQMLLRRADGTLLLGGIKGGQAAIAAFDESGASVAGFGTGGVAQLPSGHGYGPVSAIAEAPDGRLLALVGGAVVRLGATGAVDSSFGDGGQRTLSLTPTGTTEITGLATQPGGGVLVSGMAAPPLPVPTVMPLPPAPGTLYVSDWSAPPLAPDYGVVLSRLTPAGAVDCTYGRYGFAQILPDGTFAADSRTMLVDGTGRAVTIGTARGPDYNAMQLLTRTQAGTADEPELAAPVALVRGLGGYEYATQPILNGWVDPRCANVTWHFEYGPTTAYGKTTAPRDLAASGGPALVSSTLSGLGAGTYHFRLVVDGPAGPTASEDATFTMKVSTGTGRPGGDPPAAKAGRLRLLSTHASLRSGRTARFPVRCRDGACKRTTVTLRRGRVTVATGLVSLASGKKGYATVRFTAAGRRAAQRHRVLRATALLGVTGGTVQKTAVTVTSPRSKRGGRG